MHGVLHSRIDVDKVYLTREIGARGVISYEGCINMEESNLGWYFRNSVEPLKVGKLQKQYNITILSIRRNLNRVG